MRPLALLAGSSLLLGGCVLAPTPSMPSDAPPATPAEPTSRLAIDHADLGVDYMLPGAATEHEGTTHVWVVAFGGSVQEPAILRLTSDDGETWTSVEPVAIDAGALGLDDTGPIPSSVLVEDDGSWTMFGSGRLTGDRPVIWRATASGPEGPWTVHPEPLLEPAPGEWDGGVIDHPSVVASDEGYLMTYGGASGARPNRNRIGAARSADGLTWERVPITLPDADDASALGPSACGIEARTMFEPELTVADDGYRLHFGAMRTEPDVMVIGALTSDDGISWRCAVDGPVVEAGAIVEELEMHSYLVVRGGDERLLVEVLAPEALASDLFLVLP